MVTMALSRIVSETVENRKFLVPHLYLALMLGVTPSEFHSRVYCGKTKLMGPPGVGKV